MPNTIDEKEVDLWWACDICHRQFENGVESSVLNIEGYTELVCGQCFGRGMMWAIKTAWKEKNEDKNR